MSLKLETFEDVLGLTFLDSPAKLGAALGVPYVTAQVMRHRKSIGDDHWPKLIEALAGEGVGITTDDLLAMKHRRKVERQADRDAPRHGEADAA